MQYMLFWLMIDLTGKLDSPWQFPELARAKLDPQSLSRCKKIYTIHDKRDLLVSDGS